MFFPYLVSYSWYEIMINSILYGPLEYSWQTNMSIDLFILAEIVRIIFLSSHKNFHVLLQFYVQYYYNIHVSQSYQISAILYVLIMFAIRSPKHFLWCNWCFEDLCNFCFENKRLLYLNWYFFHVTENEMKCLFSWQRMHIYKTEVLGIIINTCAIL